RSRRKTLTCVAREVMTVLLGQSARTDRQYRQAIAQWCVNRQTCWTAWHGPDKSRLRGHAHARSSNPVDMLAEPLLPNDASGQESWVEVLVGRDRTAIPSRRSKAWKVSLTVW